MTRPRTPTEKTAVFTSSQADQAIRFWSSQHCWILVEPNEKKAQRRRMVSDYQLT